MKSLQLNLSPPMRFGVLLALYIIELTASLWLAYDLRFDFDVSPIVADERFRVLLWLIPTQVIFLGLFQQLTALLGYFSTPDLARIFHALFLSAMITVLVWMAGGEHFAPPRGVIALDFVLCLVGLTGVRLALRTMRESVTTPAKKNMGRARRVAIIGAGDAGAVLAHELSLKPGYGLEPVAFYDDDPRKWRSQVHGIPVVGPPEKLLTADKALMIKEAIIAMPSAPAKRVGEIVRILREASLPCKTVPSLDQLALDQVRVSQLRNVEVQDLLGREKVELQTENIKQVLLGRVVLVTGAGGSIGSELCRQIATYQPSQLILLDRSEPLLFQIEQELIGLGHGRRITSLVADIMDLERMDVIFSQLRPDVVFHAAAHKHVPMMESQPSEAVRNNSLGTARLSDVALEYGVDRFILISSDKAINPTSVMGATKRLGEIYIQALSGTIRNQTKFMAVRFGNVLGSSGSVVPLFQKQIAEGGPVRVTHPDMTRYFMTIPEACLLVLQSAAQGEGGEIFVLDMGNPIKIVDLARQMIELSGLRPDDDIQIEFVGIRPGEKLFEEISHRGESFVPTSHAKILRFVSSPEEFTKVQQTFSRMEANLFCASPEQMKLMIMAAVPEYVPNISAPGALPDKPAAPKDGAALKSAV